MSNSDYHWKPIQSQHRVEKGWGYEIWIENNNRYCGKLLFFNKGKKCSWHYHKLKEETFYLQSGRLLVRYGWDEDINKSETLILHSGESFHVPIGLKHQMKGLLKNNILFEFSTQHFDSDSIRIIPGD
jgi:mannose-6-phosphate isomerase-like protein (cupin superfamily)